MLQFDAETSALLETAYQGRDVSQRRRAALDALWLAGGETVLDIGCGNGLLTEEIARAVGPRGQVIGIDPSAEMRALASVRCADYPAVTISDGLAGALPVPDGCTDRAVAVQVLEYLSDLPAAIGDVFRCLRSGGRFVAIDAGLPTLDWFSDHPDRMNRIAAAWDNHYIEPRVAMHWTRLTQEAGFTGIEIAPLSYCDTTLRPDGIAQMMMMLMARYASENGYVSAEEARAWSDEQYELARTGRFFFSVSFYRMSAVKP